MVILEFWRRVSGVCAMHVIAAYITDSSSINDLYMNPHKDHLLDVWYFPYDGLQELHPALHSFIWSTLF